MITGTGIAANTYISALGTGTGTTGTYTMSVANTIAGGTTITASMGGPSLVPAWGVAQEGDGTAIGAATPATVSIDMASMTAAATNTIAIGGAVLTCVASGATTNQFNAGTGATLVDNIVTAINRTTNTCVLAAAATGWGTPKIQDAVFARRTGTAVLEIMYRAGSATHNANSLSQVALSGFTGGAGPYTFSGGAGGAWGYLVNLNTTHLPSALAAGSYGLLAGVPSTAGVLNAGDIVNIRSAKTLTLAGSPPTVTMANMGTLSSPVTFLIDNSTVWADGTDPKLTINVVYGASLHFSIYCSSATHAKIIAPSRKKDNYYGLNLIRAANGTVGSIVIGMGPRSFDGVYIESSATTNTPPFSNPVTGANGSSWRQENIRFKNNSGGSFVIVAGSSSSSRVVFKGLVIDNGTWASTSSLFNNLSTGGAYEFYFEDVECIGQPTGSAWFAAHTRGNFVMVNGKLGNVSNHSARVSTVAAGNGFTHGMSIAFGNTIAGRDFVSDTYRGFIEWNSARSFPTLNAVSPEGTSWSLRILPTTQSSNVSDIEPLESPPIVKLNELANGSRTITLEFCVKNGVTVNKKNVHARVSYIDTSDRLVTVSSYDKTAGALTTSTVTWSQETAGQVTFDDSGLIYLDKYKIILNTISGQDMKTGTDVMCTFCTSVVAATSNDIFFLDPDIGIA
jgi:hypothetical protein